MSEFREFTNLSDAICVIQKDGSNEVTDIIALPPDIVDCVTDEEDNHYPIGDNVLYDADIPDIAGHIEVFNGNDANGNATYEPRNIVWETAQPINFSEKAITMPPKINLDDAYEDSYKIFKKFFDDNIMLHIVKQTNLYARQNNNHLFNLTIKDLKSFIGILILTGYHKLPSQTMYWDTEEDSGFDIVKKAMLFKRFKEIKKYLHFNNNDHIDATDKLFKIRPLIEKFNKNFKAFGFFDKIISIDEQMVPYYGMHSSKMFIKGKPVRFGFKIWMMASKAGYIYSFKVYCGKETETTYSGLGESVVMTFTNELNDKEGVEVYFHNFFSSHKLLTLLKNNNINAIGTVRVNRTVRCPIQSQNTFKKEPRGSFETFHDGKGITCLQWNDTKPVILMSNFMSSYPITMVKRFSQKEKKFITITQPKIVSKYNSNMGGVDLADNAIANYRISIKGKKWYWPLFTNFISMCTVNSWKILRTLKNSKITLLQHTRTIVSELIRPQITENIRTRTSLNLNILRNTCSGICILSDPDKRRTRGVVCHNKTFHFCKG